MALCLQCCIWMLHYLSRWNPAGLLWNGCNWLKIWLISFTFMVMNFWQPYFVDKSTQTNLTKLLLNTNITLEHSYRVSYSNHRSGCGLWYIEIRLYKEWLLKKVNYLHCHLNTILLCLCQSVWLTIHLLIPFLLKI